MKRQEKIDLIASSIGKNITVRLLFKYDVNYRYYYPNAVNNRFIVGQEETDFLLDGYHIGKISNLRKAELKDNLCDQIDIWKGVVDGIKQPEIDISSWQSIFQSPAFQNEFVIIEDENNLIYKIGFIVKATTRYVLLNSFDADGIFESEPTAILYSGITHVAWKTRYSDTWYQYMKCHDMILPRDGISCG